MDKDKKFSPGWILIPPSLAIDTNLSNGAKMLYGKILGLINKKGYCYASNSWLSSQLDLSKNTISKYISQLVETGYIRREVKKDDEDKVIERRLYPQLFDYNMGGINQMGDRGGEQMVEGSVRVSSVREDKKNNVSSKERNDTLDFNEDSKQFKMTCYLIDKIINFNPRTNVPNKSLQDTKMVRWCKAMDKLHRLGPKGNNNGYGWDEIENIIDWIFEENDFWPQQVQSATGLRDKIITIENQYRSSGNGKDNNSGINPDKIAN